MIDENPKIKIENPDIIEVINIYLPFLEFCGIEAAINVPEISTEKEAMASRTIAERGVQLIATAHGNTLDNLIINPTLSDLIGGVKSVTLGDIEARRRRTQKTVLEREFEPTFDILVEIIDRNEVSVHFDVGLSVDKKLRGISTTTEVRKISDGKLIRINDQKYNNEFSTFEQNNTKEIKIPNKSQKKSIEKKINVFPFGLQKAKLKKLSKKKPSRIIG